MKYPVVVADAEDAFARGVQYGGAAREQIAVSVETYRAMFEDFVGVGWSEARAIGEGYAAAIDAYDSQLLQEIAGIAQGSGFAESEILALNVRSEIALAANQPDGCTALAAFGRATADGGTLLAQNWDWRGSQREACVCLIVRREGRPDITMVTEGGIVGKLGFNSAGLGVCLNALVAGRVERRGTPLHIVLRGILEATTLADAIEAVGRTKIASAAHYLVAQHGAGAVSIEATPERTAIGLPEPGCNTLVHTNHLCHPRLVDVEDRAATVFPDSYPRFAHASRLVETARGAITVDVIQKMLGDHVGRPDAICRHEDHGDPAGRRMESVFGLVIDLAAQRMWVTDGPPCEHSFVTIEADVALRSVAGS